MVICTIALSPGCMFGTEILSELVVLHMLNQKNRKSLASILLILANKEARSSELF